MFIDRVREHVRQACLRDANIFGPAFFGEHLVVVADTAARLAICLKADCRVRNLAFTEGREWLRSLIEEQWQGLIEPARELVASQYTTTIQFLSDGRCA